MRRNESKETPDNLVELHPGIADGYRAIVLNLRDELAARPAEGKREVIASVRDLVEKIIIYPKGDPKERDLVAGFFATLP
jgi:hypothetical protein